MSACPAAHASAIAHRAAGAAAVLHQLSWPATTIGSKAAGRAAAAAAAGESWAVCCTPPTCQQQLALQDGAAAAQGKAAGYAGHSAAAAGAVPCSTAGRYAVTAWSSVHAAGCENTHHLRCIRQYVYGCGGTCRCPGVEAGVEAERSELSNTDCPALTLMLHQATSPICVLSVLQMRSCLQLKQQLQSNLADSGWMRTGSCSMSQTRPRWALPDSTSALQLLSASGSSSSSLASHTSAPCSGSSERVVHPITLV